MSWRPWGSCTTRWTGEQSNTRFFYFLYTGDQSQWNFIVQVKGVLRRNVGIDWHFKSSSESWLWRWIHSDCWNVNLYQPFRDPFPQMIKCLWAMCHFFVSLQPHKKLALGWLKLQWTRSCVKKFECNKASYCGAFKSFRHASPRCALLNFMLEITN